MKSQFGEWDFSFGGEKWGLNFTGVGGGGDEIADCF